MATKSPGPKVQQKFRQTCLFITPVNITGLDIKIQGQQLNLNETRTVLQPVNQGLNE